MLAIRLFLSKLIKAQNNMDMRRKFAPFIRKDLHMLDPTQSLWWLTAWPRFIFYFSWAAFTFSILSTLYAGKSMETLDEKSRKRADWILQTNIRVLIFINGGYCWSDEKEQFVDYSKWLGPEWKPSYDTSKAPTLVVNHTSWIDVYWMIHKYMPSFTAKSSTKNVPMVGKVADYLGTIYVDRGEGKARSNAGDMIIAH
jgi:hypothetical protein